MLRLPTNPPCGIGEIERGPQLFHVCVSASGDVPPWLHPPYLYPLSQFPPPSLPPLFSSLSTVLSARATKMSKTQCLPTSTYGL